MKVIILGTAAGGGFPQWNCACPRCVAVRGNRPNVCPRTQDCIAVSATGRDWWLVNVSPDIRTQIIGQPLLAAGPGPRETPIRGALLTDAELDHATGLLMLREATEFRVYAPVLPALEPIRAIIDSYHTWTWAVPPADFELDGLRYQVFPMHDKPPRYATPGPGPWAIGYRITDVTTGGVVVYAPCVREWPCGFDQFVAGAHHVLLDGTFYRPDEMSTAAGSPDRDQRGMGHLPVSASRPLLRPGASWHYTHLNNTNPLLDNDSPEWAELRAAGVDVPADGTLLEL